MPDLNFFNTIEPLSLAEIASISGCTIHTAGKSNLLVKGVAAIDAATPDDLTFLSNQKYASSLMDCKAAACILSEENISKAPAGMAILTSKNPYAAYAKIATAFYPDDKNSSEISPQAFIDAAAKIGDGCTIEAGAFIGKNAKIGNNTYIASGAYIGKGVQVGNNCTISHNVTLNYCIVGNNVLLHPGVRIGQDGFGFATEHGVHLKVPQLGRVIIEDHVEVGANSCIDRGAGPDTVIGQGTKIDNLVQIGHNVKTGRGCIFVACRYIRQHKTGRLRCLRRPGRSRRPPKYRQHGQRRSAVRGRKRRRAKSHNRRFTCRTGKTMAQTNNRSNEPSKKNR